VPYLPEQAAHHNGAPSMSLDCMRLGVETAIKTALSTTKDAKLAGGTIC
jgi:pyroglutamyl-peptidase